MDVLRKWLNGLRAHLRSMSRRSCVVGLFLVAMVIAGGVLLVASRSPDDHVAVHAEVLSPEALSSARSCLAESGIDHRVELGRLLVSRGEVSRVRAILSRRRALGGKGVSAFEKLAGEDNIWLTPSGSARRWQAAKMAELSKLIGGFPSVLRATVILETGSPRRLGAPAVSPTAAVHVTMQGRARMAPQLARAAADLVAGSVAGMKASDVRIVDSSGQSFRVSDDGPTSRAAPAVVVSGSDSTGSQRAAPSPADSPAPGGGARRGGYTGVQVAATALLLAAAITLASAVVGWVVLRRRSLRAAVAGDAGDAGDLPEDEEPSPKAPLPAPAGQAAEAAPATGKFGFLQTVPAGELAGLLELEHPQTLAIILSHPPPEAGGAVLAGLSEPKRVEVARRLVDLGQIDPTVVDEIEQALSSRLAEAGRRQEVRGGLTATAEMLQHAGYATEKLVLDALSVQRPALAERIRRKLLVFEDLSKAPSGALRVVLVEMDREELAVALRTAGKDLKRQLLSCLPGRLARQVRREMEQMGPVRLSDVEAAQQRIVDAVRPLTEEASGGAESPRTKPFLA